MIHKLYPLDGGGQLLVWQTTESAEELLNELQLPENRAEYHVIKTHKRQMEFLGVRVALKRLTGKEFHIFYDKSGKPFLPTGCYMLGISHSREWVAVAIHPTRQVGVDIECSTEKILRVQQRFLSETEQTALSKSVDTKQIAIAWSGKEALYKIIGKESADFAHTMHVRPFDAGQEGEFAIEYVPDGTLYRLHYTCNSNYTLVYCLDKKRE